MILTSASANKLIKKLTEEKEFISRQEAENYSYVVSEGEEFEKPEYDFMATQLKITTIDNNIRKLKHAINLNNINSVMQVRDKFYTIDEALVLMAQLNDRQYKLNSLRSVPTKKRLGFNSSRDVVEYKYANFNPADANDEYQSASNMITEIQLALDKYNNTFEFEVDITL